MHYYKLNNFHQITNKTPNGIKRELIFVKARVILYVHVISSGKLCIMILIFKTLDLKTRDLIKLYETQEKKIITKCYHWSSNITLPFSTELLLTYISFNDTVDLQNCRSFFLRENEH